MKRERRHFDKDFKEMAVELCLTGKSPTDVARELGIKPDLVCRWRRESEKYGTGRFSGNGNANLTEEQKEIARLKKELQEAKLESGILKKAVSIFSKENSRPTAS